MTEIVDEAKLEALAGKVIGDVASALSLLMSYIGDQSGVYDALDGAGALTVDELATKTGLNTKYLLQWLGSNAAAGYVNHHADDERLAAVARTAIDLRQRRPARLYAGIFPGGGFAI